MQRSGHIIMADYAAVDVVTDVDADVIAATVVVDNGLLRCCSCCS